MDETETTPAPAEETPATPAPVEETTTEAPATAPAVPTSEPVTDPEKDSGPELVKAFIDDYGELVKKHGIDFASYPVFIPNGRGGFDIIVQNTPVNIKNQPVKSPIQPNRFMAS